MLNPANGQSHAAQHPGGGALQSAETAMKVMRIFIVPAASTNLTDAAGDREAHMIKN